MELATNDARMDASRTDRFMSPPARDQLERASPPRGPREAVDEHTVRTARVFIPAGAWGRARTGVGLSQQSFTTFVPFVVDSRRGPSPPPLPPIKLLL